MSGQCFSILLCSIMDVIYIGNNRRYYYIGDYNILTVKYVVNNLFDFFVTLIFIYK